MASGVLNYRSKSNDGPMQRVPRPIHPTCSSPRFLCRLLPPSPPCAKPKHQQKVGDLGDPALLCSGPSAPSPGLICGAPSPHRCFSLFLCEPLRWPHPRVALRCDTALRPAGDRHPGTAYPEDHGAARTPRVPSAQDTRRSMPRTARACLSPGHCPSLFVLLS